MDLIISIATIALTWWALAAVFLGLGWLVAGALGLRQLAAERITTSFWMGLAAAVAGLQIWHFAFPVDGRCLTAVGTAGLGGLIVGRREFLVVVRSWRPGALAAAAVVTVGLAYRALEQPQNGDTLLYHLGSVRWAATYPIVPGIGNLNPFLAYGHSYSLYVALLDCGWFAHRSHHLANGLLVLMLFVGAAGGLRALFSARATPVDMISAVLLIPAVDLALGRDLTSPASNFGEFAISAALAVEWVAALQRAPRMASGRHWWVVMLLASTVVFKLSSAVVAFATFIVAAWFAGKNGDRKRILLVGAALGAILVAPFAAGVALRSGYFPYPYPLLELPVTWRVPQAVHHAITSYITGYCRGTLFTPTEGWVYRWLESMLLMNRGFLLPVTIGIAGALHLGVARWKGIRPALSPVLLVPVTVALLAWFMVSPALDYVGSLLWALSGVTLALGTHPGLTRPASRGVAAAIVLLAAWPLSDARQISLTGTQILAAPIPEREAAMTRSGLRMFVGPSGCGDSPVPCANYFEPMLRAVEPGRLEAGFTLAPAQGERLAEGWRPAFLDFFGYPRIKHRSDLNQSVGQPQ